ncbi:MAG TPA: enoyl-CoA hydratase/isomerase family protein [Gemmatimonadales bacterium]
MAEAAFDTVLTAVDGGVGTVTLNRPDKLNALTTEMAGEIGRALAIMAKDERVRCIVLAGAGRAFCAGADLSLLQDLHDRKDREAGRRIVDGCRQIYRVIRDAPQIVICALNGAAAGGGANLALGCDLRIASDAASIGQVFAKLGLHPDWGGSYFLPRLVGAARAIEIFAGAEMIGAARLLELGIVNRVAPAAELAEAAKSWAARIAANPPLAMRLMKQAVYRSETESLDAMLDYELEAQLDCFSTQDFTEGLAAFKARRAPLFTGR